MTKLDFWFNTAVAAVVTLGLYVSSPDAFGGWAMVGTYAAVWGSLLLGDLHIIQRMTPWTFSLFPYFKNAPEEKGLGFAIQMLRRPFVRIVAMGIGWDADHPLRPWPWYSLRVGSKTSCPYRCLTCCGLFVGHTYMDLRDKRPDTEDPDNGVGKHS